MYSFEKRKPVPLKENLLNMGEKNPAGDEIYLNNLYFTRNSKPFMPVMGEVHISRTPRDQWEDRILKIKAIGVNVIASYIFWINHEFHEGEIDFTGENDIGEFIRLCQKHDMYFCLRLGPWVNAEYRNGGFPEWLFKSGIKLRDNNDRYLFYVERYFRELYRQVEPYLYRNGGNIIMIQLENELTNKPEHIMKLKEMILDIGFSAPIYTATGWNLIGGARLPKAEVTPMFGGYAAKPWSVGIDKIKLSAHYNFSHVRNSIEIGNDLIKPGTYEVHIDLDEYPHAYCELGTGLCVGRHRRPYISAMDDYAMSISKLGSGCNLHGYYLICGGINKLIEGMPMCRNDDNERASLIYPIFNNYFQAPIGEHGEYKPRGYQLIKLVNLFMRDFGGELAKMQAFMQENQPKDTDDTSLRYAMRTDGKGGYIFVLHHAHLLELKPVFGVRFKVSEALEPIPSAPIDVTEDDAFFFPFNQKMGNNFLDYAMAQPICKTENTVFFKKINGIAPVFKFESGEPFEAKVGKACGFELNGTRYIVLSDEEAEHIYKFDGRVYIGDGCELLYDIGKILRAGFGACRYFEYDGESFAEHMTGEEVELAEVSVREVSDPIIEKRYLYELFENLRFPSDKEASMRYRETAVVNRRLLFSEIEVTNPYGYVHIDYSGDTAQLYYDGKFSDDHFYNGSEWVIPAAHMYGKRVILAISEYTHDIYVDIPPKHELCIEKIYVSDM